MTPYEFKASYGWVADAVSADTGIAPDALLAQWGVECAFGNAINNLNNLGNIRCGSGSFCQYPTLSDFVAAAGATWHNGYYADVLAAQGPYDQLVAIGASPWDAGHYGGPPYTSLMEAYFEIMILNQAFKEYLIQVLWAITQGTSAPSQAILSDGTAGDPSLPPLPGANQVANDGSNLNVIFANFWTHRKPEAAAGLPPGTMLDLVFSAKATTA